jgi:hypothetical protein
MSADPSAALAGADVFVHSVAPQSAARVGVDPASVRALFRPPTLVSGPTWLHPGRETQPQRAAREEGGGALTAHEVVFRDYSQRGSLGTRGST